MNWYGIWALKKLGLARHIYRVKLSELREQEREKLISIQAAAPVSSAEPELVSS